eukprot:GEZU01013404.1.p1 GENE.GEZU01013404.1~~GEZU01013404.1.p1  ORF type:complete len:252 (+),score=17.26 GEZU01013404.1:199-954(+)
MACSSLWACNATELYYILGSLDFIVGCLIALYDDQLLPVSGIVFVIGSLCFAVGAAVSLGPYAIRCKSFIAGEFSKSKSTFNSRSINSINNEDKDDANNLAYASPLLASRRMPPQSQWRSKLLPVEDFFDLVGGILFFFGGALYTSGSTLFTLGCQVTDHVTPIIEAGQINWAVASACFIVGGIFGIASEKISVHKRQRRRPLEPHDHKQWLLANTASHIYFVGSMLYTLGAAAILVETTPFADLGNIAWY